MRIFFILTLLFTLYSPLAMAQFALPEKIENHVKVDIKAARDAVVPGEAIDLAIIQSIPEGWHTYWINPGDSGAESQFIFDAPQGFTFTDIQWPTPERIPYDILMNYGFEDQAVFISQMQAPATLDAYHIKIGVKASWLVCKDICIPESQDIEITLPVRQESKAANTDLFEAARDKFPIKKDVKSYYKQDGGSFILTVPRAEFQNQNFINFFPVDYGLIENAPAQTIVSSPTTTVFSAPRGTRKLSEIGNSDFVIVSDTNAYQITAMAAEPEVALPTPPPASAQSGFAYHLILALIGGLILNLMPCVFPVLSLKAIAITQLRGNDKKDVLMHGVLYTAGILISFAAFAAVILALRETGTALGWGFHLQNPLMILFLVYLMFAIALNLLGLYTIAGRFMNWGQGLGNNKTKTGSFFTGVLAALVATPCTAPFMAAAIGYAAVQPAFQSMAIFLMVGFGLALPYLLLTLLPPLQKLLPKPGAWMDTFKKILSVPMFLTTVWLLWVLHQQAGMMAAYFALFGLLVLFFVLKQKKLSLMLGGLVFLMITAPLVPVDILKSKDDLNAWSPEKLQAALQTDNPVFINMTASWCITCKINERTTLMRDQTLELFKDNNVEYLVGDWTNEDDQITQYLLSFERNGVPLYVFYPRPHNGERPAPVLLPQILTPEIVKNAVTR